jgi:cell division protein ZapA
MGQVSVTLNGRTYRLECDDGEETHLVALAEYLSSHVDSMIRKFGQIGDDRLVLMGALMVTDELWEARRQVNELRAHIAEFRRQQSAADEVKTTAHSGLAETIEAAAERLEALGERLGALQSSTLTPEPSVPRPRR